MHRVGTTEKDSPRRRTEPYDFGSMSAAARSNAESFSLVWRPSIVTSIESASTAQAQSATGRC